MNLVHLLSDLRAAGAPLLLLLAFALFVIAFLADDDDLPGPRLCRVATER